MSGIRFRSRMTTGGSVSIKPKGREAVRSALVRAASRLLSRDGITGVSVRDIAKEACVNHGLVHRHFGSKEGLIKETIQTLSNEIESHMAPEEEDEKLMTLISSALLATVSQREYYRILAFLMLTQGGTDMIQSEFPVVRRMIAAAEREGGRELSPQALVILLLSIGLGLMVFRPYLQRATGLDEAGYLRVRNELTLWAATRMKG